LLFISEVSKLFELEVGDWCTSDRVCYISVPEVQEQTEWRCATHLFYQCEKLQLDDTNKYVLVFSVKAKHALQHQLTAPQTESVIYQSQKYKSRQNGDVRMTRNTTKHIPVTGYLTR
jgi:hypothetical protein